jgi:iron complex transport system substrate-binding protein
VSIRATLRLRAGVPRRASRAGTKSRFERRVARPRAAHGRHAPLRFLAALVVGAALGASAGCGGDVPRPGRAASSSAAPLPPSAPGPRAPAPAAAQRIVSLAPNLTEILFALGLGDRVVGVTTFCNFPAEATRLPKVGGFINPSPEAILALRPDLIIATPNVGNRALVERVMATGARVEVVDARNVEEIFPAIEAVAKAAGAEEAGRRLVASIRAALDRERSRVALLPRPRVLLCLQIEPLIAAGPGSYPGDLISLAGGENAVPPSAVSYPALSLEAVLAAPPGIIVQSLMDEPGEGTSGSGKLLGYWSRFPSIPAVAAKRVHAVPGDLLLRPGPRVAEGVAELIRLIHPEAAGPEGGASSAHPERPQSPNSEGDRSAEPAGPRSPEREGAGSGERGAS